MRRFIGLAVLFAAAPVYAQHPDGIALLRMLGSHAPEVLAPTSGTIGALVAIPSGKTAADLGVIEVVPGIGRVRGTAEQLLAFGSSHPDVHVEVMPPLHALLANAQIITRVTLAKAFRGADGTGTLVGVIDTGIDPTLSDFRDPTTQSSRIAWMLDLSMPPAGIYPDLEKQYGITDQNGNVVQGAVFQGSDLDTLIGEGKPLPVDPNGHGTHVASIAGGNGGGTPYIGMAPNARLIIVRATRDASGGFENTDVVTGATFVFDRAQFMRLPIAANLSVGSDFGPHDGTSLWEQALADMIGPTQPGRVLVAAAGNSGSIVDSPVHQAVEVAGAHVSVPIPTSAADGTVQIWVTLRAGSDVRIGLDGPDGTWVSPISNGQSAGHNSGGYQSGVIYGNTAPNTPVPQGSNGAVVLWTGNWPHGTYAVTLEGHGYADLWLEAVGDAMVPATYFAGAVRDDTITLPASNPNIIAAGCTVDSDKWTSLLGQKIGITEPLLDAYGGLPQSPLQRQPVQPGEMCYFSSAGPNVLGVPKPDIVAPGGIVVAAMSGEATPGAPNSIFTIECPPTTNTCSDTQPCHGGFQCVAGSCMDPNCAVVEAHHAVASGTSMSSPMVAGIAALLLQQDPTLTEDVVRALLQAGAHKLRGAAPFFDQTGPGEVDALGALEALSESTQPDTALPSAAKSWMTLSADFAIADGSTPVTVTLELRTSTDTRATAFDVSRLQPVAFIGASPVTTSGMVRGQAPGLFTFSVQIPQNYAGSSLTLGAVFDGQPIVADVTIPIALDSWTAGYPTRVAGGCSAYTASRDGDATPSLFLLGLLALRRRSRKEC